MVGPVAGADATIEAELGDTLNLHGVSYTGSSVYLFMTGPGLPENGVTLSDVTRRSDQGQFTQIDLDGNQEWSFRWNTARIEHEINAGTYLVYVTNEPVDKANLGGSNTYKTLEVYLKESTTSRVSTGSGTTYTLNPEMHSSVQVPTLALTSPTPTPAPVTTPQTAALTIPVPTTKASLPPVTIFLALLLGSGAVILYRQ
jgi:outer membrane receptor protein involved in Fe transport